MIKETSNKKPYAFVIASGGFDPIHKGHIEYLRKASELGDDLIVILNNDNFLIQKKGKAFMPLDSRVAVVSALSYVSYVFISIDKDMTVCKSIKKVVKTIRKYLGDVPIAFAKGGDRTKDEIPEAKICKKLGIDIVDGLGEKIESSSRIINEGCSSTNVD